jgi:hypothetical protein
MKLAAFLLLIFCCFPALCQPYSVTGNVADENSKPLAGAVITVHQADSATHRGATNKDGAFLVTGLFPGLYHINIDAAGRSPYDDSFRISDGNISIGNIALGQANHMLDEVKIVEKVLAMVQKDDTLEFNSGAYKVHPDADAADLVRKMPLIEINDKKITAQGESVVKILVDGKPFFGTDPYAALKNLPADIIDKVQVYNEKSDQEQFTGFREGPTVKTINVITKPGSRMGLFGKVYGGGGGDVNAITQPGSSSDARYGAGTVLNQFAGDRRLTFTAQSNNVNAQNFSDSNSPADGSAGTATTNSAGINYSDKWGKKTDVSGSYFFNHSTGNAIHESRKTYLTAIDSGQVYTENSPNASQYYSHRMSLRFSYKIDSMNSILITPNLSFSNNTGNSSRVGFTELGNEEINRTTNSGVNNSRNYTFGSSALYRHRFYKKGRTFSITMNVISNGTDGDNRHVDTLSYLYSPTLNDTLNQRAIQNTRSMNMTANAAYTEPAGKNGMIKLEYNINYQPANSERYTYNYTGDSGAYTQRDDRYSNSFKSDNVAHIAGVSYRLKLKNAEFSAGVNYQLTRLSSRQALPVAFNLDHDFQNLLPVVTFHYKISKFKYVQCNYNTTTQAPAVGQLQRVINNDDPLHLYTGNPYLKQPYRHNLSMQYNGTGSSGKNNFSASLTGTYVQHNISSASVFAQADSVLPGNITLPRGSQLTVPVNVDGNATVNSNINYAMPLAFIKSRLNISLNGGLAHVPGLINNQVNYQDNKSAGAGLSLSSNISENVDFILSSNTSLVTNDNSINRQLNTHYVSENARATINLISGSGLVFNTTLSYQSNSGLTGGFDRNYLLCNMSVGKKIFSKHQGDIRLTVYDLLNENSNIQHVVTDVYVQDSRSNILQRYFLLVFTYKISNFKSGAH